VDRSEHPRLAALPHRAVLGVAVAVAANPRARLLGLAGIRRERAGDGLLIPRCASVHTVGMRFALDLFFLDAAEQPLLVCRALPPRRLAWCRGAVAVLEIPVEGGEFSPPAA
jgi:uncharacterized membrane protein (UPF0127 family)